MASPCLSNFSMCISTSLPPTAQGLAAAFPVCRHLARLSPPPPPSGGVSTPRGILAWNEKLSPLSLSPFSSSAAAAATELAAHLAKKRTNKVQLRGWLIARATNAPSYLPRFSRQVILFLFSFRFFSGSLDLPPSLSLSDRRMYIHP